MRTPLRFVAAWLSGTVLALGAVSAAAPMTALAQARAGTLATQTSTARGVSIKVTPQSPGGHDGRRFKPLRCTEGSLRRAIAPSSDKRALTGTYTAATQQRAPWPDTAKRERRTS